MALHRLSCLFWAERPVFMAVRIQGWLRATCGHRVLCLGSQGGKQEISRSRADPMPSVVSSSPSCGPVHPLSHWERQSQKSERVLILETLLTGTAEQE